MQFADAEAGYSVLPGCFQSLEKSHGFTICSVYDDRFWTCHVLGIAGFGLRG